MEKPRIVAGNGTLRLPEWVASEIGRLGPEFTGQIRVNLFKGGVTSLELRICRKKPL